VTTRGRPAFGMVPTEVATVRALDGLAPRFRSALQRVLLTLEGLGHDPVVIETLRGDARQRFLHGFGRLYDDGRGVVTHSHDADESWHYYGLAADVISSGRRWDAPPPFWAALGRACARDGLTWGGDWNGDGRSRDERFLDRPHLQWGPPMRRSPSPRAARLMELGGAAAVWRAVGAM